MSRSAESESTQSRQHKEWQTSSHYSLLQRHAPILRFDSRELFFPTHVEGFIESSSLYLDGIQHRPAGSVTDADLTHQPPSSYLQFITDEDRRMVVQAEVKRLARKFLGPRLGRVGLFGRILDALFILSVLIRPTTPRFTTVASALKADRLKLHDRPVCYGRVVDVGGWTVLHYSYFYVMNDWRTSYRGLNDHEADWEQAWVFCDAADQKPVWVMASSHEHAGADLRRHWNDSENHKIDGHPVLYVGAGSHALYHRPGDYVTRIDIQAFRWLLRLQRWIRRALRIRDEATERGLGPALGMPFVEAATGDGRQIDQWDLTYLDERRSCFGSFRGLWGLDTGDPIDGERGPPGPKFTRDGDVRVSWADPVGFAGLHGTSPPSAQKIDGQIARVSQAIIEIDNEINRRFQLLPLVEQLDSSDYLVEESRQLTKYLGQKVELRDLKQRLEQRAEPVVGAKDHLRHPAIPLSPPKESGWVLAVWAAVSIPLVLVTMGVRLLAGKFVNLNSFYGGLGIVAVIVVTLIVVSLFEQLARRQFQAVFRLLILYGAIGLFVVFSGLFLGVFSVLSFSGYAVGGVMTAAGVLLFFANLSELSAVQRRAEVAENQEED